LCSCWQVKEDILAVVPTPSLGVIDKRSIFEIR